MISSHVVVYLGCSSVSIFDDTAADSDYVPHRNNTNKSDSLSSNNHKLDNFSDNVEITNELIPTPQHQ